MQDFEGRVSGRLRRGCATLVVVLAGGVVWPLPAGATGPELDVAYGMTCTTPSDPFTSSVEIPCEPWTLGLDNSVWYTIRQSPSLTTYQWQRKKLANGRWESSWPTSTRVCASRYVLSSGQWTHTGARGSANSVTDPPSVSSLAPIWSYASGEVTPIASVNVYYWGTASTGSNECVDSDPGPPEPPPIGGGVLLEPVLECGLNLDNVVGHGRAEVSWTVTPASEEGRTDGAVTVDWGDGSDPVEEATSPQAYVYGPVVEMPPGGYALTVTAEFEAESGYEFEQEGTTREVVCPRTVDFLNPDGNREYDCPSGWSWLDPRQLIRIAMCLLVPQEGIVTRMEATMSELGGRWPFGIVATILDVLAHLEWNMQQVRSGGLVSDVPTSEGCEEWGPELPMLEGAKIISINVCTEDGPWTPQSQIRHWVRRFGNFMLWLGFVGLVWRLAWWAAGEGRLRGSETE